MNNTQGNQVEIFRSIDGEIEFGVNVFEETVWLTQKQMSLLFGKDIRTINEHLINCFKEGELDNSSTIRNFRIVQVEGNRNVTRSVEHYNLDAIISVGYRVKSSRGIQFRKWATKVLKQYLLNGYSINENRIRKIEESISDLISSNKILKSDVARIENLLLALIEKPIIINLNQSKDFEEKLIFLLDQILEKLGKGNVKTKITTIKNDLAISKNDQKAKNRILKFLIELGDSDSDINKILKGAGISQKIIKELLKLFNKFKDFI